MPLVRHCHSRSWLTLKRLGTAPSLCISSNNMAGVPTWSSLIPQSFAKKNAMAPAPSLHCSPSGGSAHPPSPQSVVKIVRKIKKLLNCSVGNFSQYFQIFQKIMSREFNYFLAVFFHPTSNCSLVAFGLKLRCSSTKRRAPSESGSKRPVKPREKRERNFLWDAEWLRKAWGQTFWGPKLLVFSQKISQRLCQSFRVPK